MLLPAWLEPAGNWSKAEHASALAEVLQQPDQESITPSPIFPRTGNDKQSHQQGERDLVWLKVKIGSPVRDTTMMRDTMTKAMTFLMALPGMLTIMRTGKGLLEASGCHPVA